MKKYYVFINNMVLVLFIILLCSCSSSTFNRDMENKDRFRLAVELFKNEKYESAIENLRVLSYDRSLTFADSVQFFLAECYFMREQYIIAASEYKDLVRYHPNSKLVPEARYKIAVAYSLKEPKISLDQNYTNKAITEFQTFIEYYPTHPRVRDAERQIIELRNKLAQKDFDIAELYKKMGKNSAALVYYKGVLEKYHDSEIAQAAAYEIIKIYVSQKRNDLVKIESEKFLQKYPNSPKREEVQRIRESIKE